MGLMAAPTRPGAPRQATRRTAARTGATATLSGARATPRSGVRQVRRRETPPAEVATQPVPRKPSAVAALSWRAIVLTVVIVLALAVLMPSLRAYVRQQDELAELRAQAEVERGEVADLEAELARWDDPAYVIAQARERLGYVMPGETAYRVIDPEFVEPAAAAVAEDSARAGGSTTTRTGDAAPWFESLWYSFVAAGAGEGDATADATSDATSDADADAAPDATATETGAAE